MSEEDRPITDLAGDDASSKPAWGIAEKLERDKQRKNQRDILFGFLLILCFFMYVMFFWFVYPADNFKTLAASSDKPYMAWIVSLFAIVPTVLLLALMKGVYRSTKGAEPSKSNSSESVNINIRPPSSLFKDLP